MPDVPVFIVGAPRSGTTLLRDLLRAHPRLSFPPESQVLPWWWEVHGNPGSDAEARRLAADLLGSSAISQWGLAATPAELAHHRSFAGMASALYEEWAGRDGKPRWGDKTPNHARHIPLLARLWPGAQFVHIIRDGRDVACSWLERGWIGDVHGIGLAWARTVAAGRRDGTALGPEQYLELRYEHLVHEPERTMRAVCAFLGEEYTPELLTPHRQGDPMVGAGRESYTTAIRPTSVCRWRSELDGDQQALFAAAAGDVLEDLGYPDPGPRRAPTRAELRRWSVQRRLRAYRLRLTDPGRVPLARQTLLVWRAQMRRRLARG